MFLRTVDRAFRRFQDTGDPGALAVVFDRTAAELLGLARHLASGEAAAEDLLQATFLTAIESKASRDPARPVVPWLVGILANHARVARRQGRRTVDPHRLRGEPLGDPSRDAEGLELQAELTAAIARLPESCRPVLRLHLQHGLEPREIAESLERPDGTVRAQLHRGLDRLRKLLPVSLGPAVVGAQAPGRGLEAVRAAVLGRYGEVATGTALGMAATVGVLTMITSKKLFVSGAAAVLACALFGYAVWSGTDPAAVTGEPPAAVPVTARLPDTPVPPALPVVDPERVEVATPTPPPTQTGPEAATTGALRVRVVADADGRPVPGIGVGVRDLTTLQNPGAIVDFVDTDARGEAVFAGLAPETWMIEVDRTGTAGAIEVAVGRETLREVRLTGVRAEGTVKDPDGNPVPGAGVWLHANRVGALLVATTDRFGRFRTEHLTPRVELQARRAGFAPSRAHMVQLGDGESYAMQLQLQPGGCLVTGRVTDPDGRPLAQAFVAIVPEAARDVAPFDRGGPQVRSMFLRTDGEGLFRTDEVAEGVHLVTAFHRRAGLAPGAVSVTAGAVAAHAELTLPEGAAIEGKVTAGVQPRLGATVIAFTVEPEQSIGYLINLLGMRTTQVGADGSYHLTGLCAGGVELRVLMGGELLGQRMLEVAAGSTQRVDIDTAGGKPFVVRVRPARAPGVMGSWLVVLHRADGEAVEGVSAQVSDPSGRVRYTALKRGRYEAFVYCQPAPGDLVLALRQQFAAEGSETTLDVPADRLRLQPVSGRVVDAMEAPVAGLGVTLRGLEEGAEVVVLQRTTDLEGRFEFAGLPPGRYALRGKDSAGEVRDLEVVTVVGDRREALGDLRW